MDELNVGVIGCGMLAQDSHLPNVEALQGACLRWACDVAPDTLAAVAAKFGAERSTRDFAEVLGDPETDAIVLATTQAVRLPVIEAAARAGVPVYCEKPIADTLAEMERIGEIVEAAGIVFCVGQNRRSAPAMRYARDVFQSHRRSPAPCPWRFDRNSHTRARWPEEDQAFVIIRINDDVLSWKEWAVQDDAMVGGPMLFEMVHFTDMACWLLGERPVRVTALGHHRMNHTVVIDFEDESVATIMETGVGTFGYPKELFELYAQGGVVVMDHFAEVRTAGIGAAPRKDFPITNDAYPDVTDGGGIRDFYAKRLAAEREGVEAGDPELTLARSPGVDKGHRAHLAAFLDAVRGKCESPCTCAESILATRISFAALESQREGRPVGL